jgi:hypothetical protein
VFGCDLPRWWQKLQTGTGGDHQIVISTDGQCASFFDQVDAGRRIRTVPHNISQTEDVLDSFSINFDQHCFESRQVGVDVGKDSYSQGN